MAQQDAILVREAIRVLRGHPLLRRLHHGPTVLLDTVLLLVPGIGLLGVRAFPLRRLGRDVHKEDVARLRRGQARLPAPGQAGGGSRNLGLACVNPVACAERQRGRGWEAW